MLLCEMLRVFRAFKVPNEAGISPKSWFIDKSNKVYRSRLWLERPCIDLFQFTTRSLNLIEGKEPTGVLADIEKPRSDQDLLSFSIIPTRFPKFCRYFSNKVIAREIKNSKASKIGDTARD